MSAQAQSQSVLVVDDDRKIRSLLRNLLEDDGFEVVEAMSEAEIRAALEAHDISLITLDIHLGAENGLEIARHIRRDSSVPVIMVTGRDDVIDRVVGLELGADDYITKPFHVREVIARIRAVLRRAAAAPATEDADPYALPSEFQFDGMTTIPDQLVLVNRDGSECALTNAEFKLLTVFLERPNRVLSRDQLMDLTGGLEWTPLDRTIDNQIARLRKKIERDNSKPKLIKTVRGVGYLFACDIQVSEEPSCLGKSA